MRNEIRQDPGDGKNTSAGRTMSMPALIGLVMTHTAFLSFDIENGLSLLPDLVIGAANIR